MWHRFPYLGYPANLPHYISHSMSLWLVNKTIPARPSLLPTACQSSVTTSQLFTDMRIFPGYWVCFTAGKTPVYPKQSHCHAQCLFRYHNMKNSDRPRPTRPHQKFKKIEIRVIWSRYVNCGILMVQSRCELSRWDWSRFEIPLYLFFLSFVCVIVKVIRLVLGYPHKGKEARYIDR